MRLLWPLCTMIAAGCSSRPTVFADSYGEYQEKPEGATATSGALNTPTRTPVLQAGYTLTISTPNTQLCSSVGAIEFTIYDDLTYDVPSAKVSCLSLTIDLASLISLAGKASSSNSQLISGIDVSDGRLVRVTTMNGVTYSPARPLMVLPPLQNPAGLTPFQETNNYQAAYTDADGAPQTTSGTIGVNVPETDGTFVSTAANPNLSYDHVVTFIMTADGFAGMPRAKNLLLDSLEIDLNTNPLSIPRIHIETDVSTLLQGGVLGGVSAVGTLANSLIGKLTIELLVEKEDYLDNP